MLAGVIGLTNANNKVNSINILDCYNTGNISAITSTDFVAGVVGNLQNKTEINTIED